MQTNSRFPLFVISLDIGGTKIAGCILRYRSRDNAPEIVFHDKVAAEAKKGVDAFASNIIGLAKSLNAKAEEIDSSVPVVAIGMGCAGRINKDSGNVMTATDNFPGFVGYALCANVSKEIGVPAYALNDVQAHTMGEFRWGAGRDSDNFILLAIGTGIGGCAVLNGKLMLGSHGYAGELGHVQVSLGHDVPCTCGKAGHLEAVASGSGIELSFAKLKGIKLSGAEISKLANEGDEDAIASIELAGRSLGRVIAMYHSVFDPEKIILGGSVIKSGKI